MACSLHLEAHHAEAGTTNGATPGTNDKEIQMTFINRLAGLVVLTGAAAFAQSDMKLNVPFTFHTSRATLAPGTYAIQHLPNSGSGVYKLRNMDTRKSTIVVAPIRVTRDLNNGEHAKVEFKCAGEYCALATIYGLAQPAGDSIPVKLRNVRPGEKEASVMIQATVQH